MKISILSRLKDLDNATFSEKIIIKYILSNPQKVVLMTCEELAGKTFTSAPTVIRLCKKVNIDGFSIFKVMLAQEVDGLSEEIDIVKNQGDLKKDDFLMDVINKLTNNLLNAIKNTNKLLDEDNLKKIVEHIGNAEVLDFYGAGSSFLIAQDAAIKFMRVGKCTITNSLYDRQHVQAINSKKNHFAFVFTYMGETIEMIKIVEILNEKQIPYVVVTSLNKSTITKISTNNIYVPNHETVYRIAPVDSRMTMLHVIDILYCLYCLASFDESMSTIAQTRI